MAGNARAKIDKQTMSMFDPEVDKPEHDHILTTLFQDVDQQKKLLMAAHGFTELLRPFTENSKFTLKVQQYHGYEAQSSIISLAEAVKLTGANPVWKDPHPIRLGAKELESILTYSSEGSKYSRIIGYIDMRLRYSVATRPYVYKHYNSDKYSWTAEKKPAIAYFEVKSAWPTVGNLIRQLNLYRQCSWGEGLGSPSYYLVGPDDSVAEFANHHGWQMVTFDQALQFRLLPVVAKPEEAIVEGGF